jgi:RNA polymerase sigma-70 factor (ECF subfamily)
MTARTSVAGGVNELEQALADEDAFEAWYRRTLPRVYSYLLSRCGDPGVAEDLAQETFAAAIDRQSRFDARSDVTTWLLGIARHKLADHFRALERRERGRRRIEVREIGLGEAADATPDVDDALAVAEILRSLPVAQRAVLAFVVLDDLPVAAAARLLGKSPKATESLLFRARENVRAALSERARP